MSQTPNPNMTAAELLASIDAPVPVEKPDEVVPREWSIDVDYRLGDGTRLQGTFVHRIPSPDDDRKIELGAAIMRGGQPRHAFSVYGSDIIDALVYLGQTLIHQPDWAKEKGLGAIPDPGLLFSVWRAAVAHRERFRLASRDLRPSEGAA